jgi:hypothetical protein
MPLVLRHLNAFPDDLEGLPDGIIHGKKYRIDFGFSLGPRYRPQPIRPHQLLFCELNSKEFHEGTFEQDSEKRNAFDRAGFHHIGITPNQVTPKTAKKKKNGLV